MTKATTTTKSTAPKAPRKPRTTTKKAPATEAVLEVAGEQAVKHTASAPKVHAEKAHKPSGKYVFATGRRKTSIANVRMFEGKGDMVVNKKPLDKYFSYSFYQDEVIRPLEVTGLQGHYYFTAHINGGGPHSQAGALRHGISTALGKISPEVRKVLKKNGFLTRDDRKKERKKPGLKRARRSPQWAKR